MNTAWLAKGSKVTLFIKKFSWIRLLVFIKECRYRLVKSWSGSWTSTSSSGSYCFSPIISFALTTVSISIL